MYLDLEPYAISYIDLIERTITVAFKVNYYNMTHIRYCFSSSSEASLAMLAMKDKYDLVTSDLRTYRVREK